MPILHWNARVGAGFTFFRSTSFMRTANGLPREQQRCLKVQKIILRASLHARELLGAQQRTCLGVFSAGPQYGLFWAAGEIWRLAALSSQNQSRNNQQEAHLIMRTRQRRRAILDCQGWFPHPPPPAYTRILTVPRLHGMFQRHIHKPIRGNPMPGSQGVKV
jgi:hypothetical protein